jgi:hypothetical protein
LSIIAAMNDVPNSNSAPLSPTQLVTHRKPTPRPYSFGQTGLYYITNNKETRSAWGIYLGSNTRGNGHRLYVPNPSGTGRVVMAMKFQPMDQWQTDGKPSPAKLTARLRSNVSLDSGTLNNYCKSNGKRIFCLEFRNLIRSEISKSIFRESCSPQQLV